MERPFALDDVTVAFEIQTNIVEADHGNAGFEAVRGEFQLDKLVATVLRRASGFGGQFEGPRVI